MNTCPLPEAARVFLFGTLRNWVRRGRLARQALSQSKKPLAVFFDYAADLGITNSNEPIERIQPNSVTPTYLAMHLAPYYFALPYTEGKHVLEVGCNWGYGASLLAESAAHVTAFDIAEDAIHYAARTFRKPNLGFFVHDANYPFPLPSNIFELVFSSEVIEHIREYRRCLSQIAHVLTPNGYLLMKTPNFDQDPQGHRQNPYHLKVFRPDEYTELLQEFFTDVRVVGYNEVFSHTVQQVDVDMGISDYHFGDPIPLSKKLEITGYVRPELRDVTHGIPHYLLAICRNKRPFVERGM